LKLLTITKQIQKTTGVWNATVTDPPLCMCATESRLSISLRNYYHELY